MTGDGAKEKIAFVVRQYGLEVNGGGETHCRELAEHLLEYYTVEVLSSCSHALPWDNYYEKGESELNGVIVKRFPVEKEYNRERKAEANIKRLNGEPGAEKEWIEESGPFCPQLIKYLSDNGSEYKSILFMSYAHYTTVMGMGLDLNNTILIPTAHDEPDLYKSLYKKVFNNARAFLFNTEEEKDLIEQRFGPVYKPYRITCYGIDCYNVDDDRVKEHADKYGEYVIYAGRLAGTKNYNELARFFGEYKKRHPSGLKLLVIGRRYINYTVPYHEDIEYLGFVSDTEKYELIRGAKFMILPSKRESLSIVVLESFAMERPVVVNGYCPVLRGQLIRSNGGLYYNNYAEFDTVMEWMLTHDEEREQMGKNGKKYVSERYQWKNVIKNVLSLIDEVGV